ncbi:hypothetical protein WG66_000181 [Moniliophthora roreri]|uniref:Uncharacterized protein n=1 Tax=Moniliophthora roreri TaxID=221103 RepID=A0A0W0EY09_MONRR|nr:hypothetical protein WG66_000181 [Moniliophthora roreri]
MTAFLNLLLFLLASGSFARVYITRPFAETVWSAGKPAEMTWIDDGDSPHIWDSKMKGKAVGDLYCFEGPEKELEIYIASVPIKALKDGFAVFILPDACSFTYCGYKYYYEMRIISNNLTSYSHPFTITNTECSPRSSSSESTNRLPPKSSKAFAEQDVDGDYLDTPPTSLSESLTSTSSSSVTSSSSLHSVPQATTVSGPSNTMHSMQQSTASTVYADPLQTPGQQASFGKQGHRNAASSRSKMNGRWMDFEKIKFRLIFIVWPALVGISMAM